MGNMWHVKNWFRVGHNISWPLNFHTLFGFLGLSLPCRFFFREAERKHVFIRSYLRRGWPDVIEKYGTIFEPKTENYEPLEGDIIFKNVTFDYGNGVEVIHPLNLTIEKGKSLAIVGETGSGKTTLVNLLCRFYEPTTGEILVNGKDYRNFSVGWLRSNIGYVQQNPYVFTGTIKQNIRYGRENATDEEIEKIGKLVVW